MSIDINALAQTEINDALAQLKQLSEYPTPSTQYARVLCKYITSLLEALEKAQTENGLVRGQLLIAQRTLLNQQQRIAELENAASEPVAWTDEQELRDVEKSGCGYLFTVNPITPNADPRRVIKLYTVQPAMESRTVTVKLPQRLQPGADGYDDWYMHSAEDGEYLKADDVIAVLAAAGIRVIEGEG